MRPDRRAQHRRGIVGVARLAEDFVVEHHFGVGAQHHGAGFATTLQQSGAGLLAGDPAHVFFGGFAGLAVFGNVEIEHAEIQPEAGQQFGATGRLGGEMSHSLRSHNPR